MDRYNFRTTSLNNTQLTAELTKRGAKTFGSLERKQQRLQRFLDREEKLAVNRTTLQVVIQNQQRLVYERQQVRAEELLRPKTRSQRVANALYECLIH